MAASAAGAGTGFAVMHELGLVLGVVEVHVGHDPRVLGAGAADELAGGEQELVGDVGQLAHPPPGGPVGGLAAKPQARQSSSVLSSCQGWMST
jgi:hypothetical protein